jgi:hypothetical protein
MGALFDDVSPDTVDEGDIGAPRMSTRRELYVQLRDAAGNERGAKVDASGNVMVNIAAGAGSGGTAMTDHAAFTPASSSITPIGGEVDDTTPNYLDEGDTGAVRMSATRAMHVMVRDAAGNERGLNVDASGNIGVTDAGGALTVDGTVTLGAGSAAFGKLAANSGVDIGDVDILTLPAVGLTAGTQMVGYMRLQPVAVSSGDYHAPAANTAATVTLASTASLKHCISQIVFSYNADPTNGNLLVQDAGTTVFSMDVTKSGPGQVLFNYPLKQATANTQMVITLAAGGASATGKVNCTHWTEA